MAKQPKNPLSEFAVRGAAAQAAVDKFAATKGAVYPMRALAELARGSARVWDAWAAKPDRRPEMAYGARSLSLLHQAMAYVMDTMGDHERQEDEPPPAASCRPPK